MSEGPFGKCDRIVVYESDYSHHVVVFENGEPYRIEHITTVWTVGRGNLSTRLLRVIEHAKQKRDEMSTPPTSEKE